MEKVDVLDKGFIELVDHLGSDLTVVNSARVSFGKRKSELDENDKKLIKYLAKHKHFSPFRHVQLQFHIKAPETVARQVYKHVVGSDYAFKDTPWNEISGRYVEYKPEFYIPKYFRKQSKDNKQASLLEEVDRDKNCPRGYRRAIDEYEDWCEEVYEMYKSLLADGVCREQARMVLPFSLYTEWYWTASLQAVCNLISLRDDDHAQWETREYAKAFRNLAEKVAPYSMGALFAEV